MYDFWTFVGFLILDSVDFDLSLNLDDLLKQKKRAATFNAESISFHGEMKFLDPFREEIDFFL